MVAPAAVLAVGRAKDDMLRKLIAMCPGNFLFRTLTEMFGDNPELLDLGMLGGSILGKVYAPSDEGCWSSSDANQAFTSVLLPEWMWYLQATPPILAKEVPAAYSPRGRMMSRSLLSSAGWRWEECIVCSCS